MIKVLYNYSANQLTSEKKLKRVYLSSASFSAALNDFYKPGMLVENAVLSLKLYRFFWRDAYNHEVDFIEINNNIVTPVEVKYKIRIRKSDYNNLYLFCKKFKVSGAVMLVNAIEPQTVVFKGLSIEIKPVYSILS